MFGLMFPLTFVIFMLIIGWAGVRSGYWLSMSIYWVIIIAFTLYFLGFRGIRKLYQPDKSAPQIWGWLAFIPVIATFFVSFLPSFFHLKMSLMILTISTGVINGTCEELFWRGLTLTTENKYKSLVIAASLIGFGFWHFTLARIDGLKYQGGIGALIGGAIFMGILWQFVTTKTKNILYSTVAHILVNIFAFSAMILANWQ